MSASETPSLDNDVAGVGRSAFRGAAWVSVAKFAVQVVQFAVGLVLARLLAPEDFGLVGSVYVITGLAVLFFDLGLGEALVHADDPTDADKSTVFWVNVLGGLIFAAGLWAAAPWVADLFGQPELEGLTPLVALAFTFSFGVVHEATLRRELRFRAVAVIEIVSATIGMATTVALALVGVGAASLALGPILTTLSASVLSIAASRWRPHSFISMSSLRRLWSFTGGLLGARVVQFTAMNVDTFAIARFDGPAALGYYNRAFNLMLLPINQLGGAVGSVMFPVLARMQDQQVRLQRAYIRSASVVQLISLPTLVAMGVTAPVLVPTLWGSAWDPAIPILQLLAIAGLPRSLMMTVTWALQACGRTKLQFGISSFEAGLVVLAVAVGIRWGAAGVAASVAAVYWIIAPVATRVGLKALGIRSRELLRPLWPICAANIVMGLSMFVVAATLGIGDLPKWAMLGVELGVGLVVYALVIVTVARQLTQELRAVLRRSASSGSLVG